MSATPPAAASASDGSVSAAAPAAPHTPAPLGGTPAGPLVLSRREGAITRITLNRPRAINALTSEMFALISAAVSEAQHDGSAAIVLDGAGERGFCGGGDVKEMSSGDTRAILAQEYRVDHALATSAVPVISLMDGITMGGGIGLGGHAQLRVVTERSRLAMPEARIGIVPDVGGHLLLAAAPGRLGEFLAVTAAEMTAGDAIALGFADCFVPSERLDEWCAALAAGSDARSSIAHVSEAAPSAPLLQARLWWDPIAEAALGGAEPSAFADPVSAALRLVEALEHSELAEAREAAATVHAMSPTSVAITLAQIARTREERLSLAEVLADDLRVLGRLAERPDFREGVRAQVIDKDRTPRWTPERLDQLDRDELAAVLDPAARPDEHALAL